ncbi:MAG: stage V sporulation protein AD [Oscillospiraceae bacterium]|nr:stage V sporulation protein AD [Oscillospiraceae bacterium]
MSGSKIGKQTFVFSQPPVLIGHAAVAGKKEGEGPLGSSFDQISMDSYWDECSWEKAESVMQRTVLALAADKAAIPPSRIEYLFAGDLLNQSIGSTFGHRDSEIPFFGLFGACSTMGEALALAAMTIVGGFAEITAAVTSSHFCTAERQFRFPLEYGGQRTPTSQWTVTGAGATILAASGLGPAITHVTPGKIVDAGITDPNNMGAAMAPAAYTTIKQHFEDTGRSPADYDLIVTGDLGSLGHTIVRDLFKRDSVTLQTYQDCGLMIFDRERQQVDAGGSGCGCAASVLNGYLLNAIRDGRWSRILFCPTGALMSTTSAQQGESIPGICHAVAISTVG